MKKIYPLIIFVIISITVQAQITSAEMPAVGFSIVYKNINKNGFDPYPSITGMGVEWDYQNAFEKTDSTQVYYIEADSCPEDTSFPGATIAEAMPPDTVGHFFYDLGSGAFYRDGFYAPSSGNLLLPYNDKAKLYELPFQFGTSYTDAYTCTNGSWDVGGGNLVSAKIDNGSYLFDCQGEGKLRVPTGYFDNVYRVYYEEYFTMKADILGDGNYMDIFTIDEYGYEYWKAGHVKPLMTYISSNYSDFNGANQTTVTVKYDKHAVPDGANTGINENADAFSVNLYPNPSTGFINIDIADKNEKTTFNIFDVVGKKVFTCNLENGPNSFDLSDLSKGIYDVKIISDMYIKTEKLVLN